MDREKYSYVAMRFDDDADATYDISIVFKPGSFTYDKSDYTLTHNIRIQVIAGIPYLAFTDQFDMNTYISLDCIAAWSVEKSALDD